MPSPPCYEVRALAFWLRANAACRVRRHYSEASMISPFRGSEPLNVKRTALARSTSRLSIACR